MRLIDTKTHENREIDRNHVADLLESFKRGTRRFFKEVRMKATMTRNDYNSFLEKYAEDNPPQTVPKARIRATNTDGGQLADFVHLETWPSEVNPPPR